VERIQEAIEKARRERQGNIGKPESQTADTEPSGTVSAGKVAAQDKPQATAESSAEKSSIRVNYSQTKTVSMSEEELKDRRIVASFAHDARSEPYRQLRGQILKKFRENNWQTLAITGPNSGSGRTLTALNLAISLSFEANQTVLLVDLDLRNPGVASCIGIDAVEHGIVDYVRGEKPLEDILINPGFERLVLLPGTPQGAFTSEILSSPEMQSVTNELVSRYPSRIIIFDLPSVLSNDDALMFAPKCDATLMVLEEGGSKKQDIERAYQLLEGCNVIGSVLNKVRYN
jgi:Mrp family chromosome partitioning ATPase